MKKLLTILVLALALCLVCGAALAGETDYANAKFGSVADFQAALDAHAAVGVNAVNIYSSNLAEVVAAATEATHDNFSEVRAYGQPDAEGKRDEVVCFVKVHSWVADNANTTKSTCKVAGVIAYKCSVPGCTKKYTVDRPLVEHTWKTVIDKQPICGVSDGLSHNVCTVCGKEDTTYTVVPKRAAHAYANGLFYLVAPSCDPTTQVVTNGKKYDVCDYCASIDYASEAAESVANFIADNKKAECVNKKNLPGDYDGHNWDEWIDGEPSCAIGTNQKRWCKTCNLLQQKELDPSKRLAAKFVAAEPITCMTNNFTVVCSLCNGAQNPNHKLEIGLTAKDVKDDAERHITSTTWVNNANPNKDLNKLGAGSDTNDYISWTITVTNEANEVFYFTSYHVFDTPEIANTRTSYPDRLTANRCTTPLYAQFLCSKCANKLTLQVADPLGHKWGEWEVAEEGEKPETTLWKRTCPECLHIETLASATKPVVECKADAHDYKPVRGINSKCLASENAKFVCSKCGKVIYKSYTWPHELEVRTLIPATCKADGQKIEVCKVCKVAVETVLKKEDVEHTPGTPIVTPATLEKEGSEVVKCTVCDAVISTKVLPKLVADAKYEVKNAEYDGKAVSGKVEHVKDTKELAAAFARVTFFYADGTFAVMVVPVEDGEFYAGATTATVHVAVQIVDNAKQITPPAESAIYGSAPATMK